MQRNFQFLAILLLALLLVFGVHIFVLNVQEYPLFDNKIIRSYAVNFVLAGVILFFVERNMKDGSAKGGFIFFAGSLLKFLVFFIVFYPSYTADGKMETIEFTTFFVPYALCLILEVYHLGKQLNNQSFSEENNSDKPTTISEKKKN